jgi:hypothetical protein
MSMEVAVINSKILSLFSVMALKSETLFEKLSEHLKTKGEILVQKYKAIIRFEVFKEKGGAVTCWTYDLKSGSGVGMMNK